MNLTLRKTGRSLLVFVTALIPCALLVLSLVKMSPPPARYSSAPTTFALTFHDPVSAAEPNIPPAPATDKPEPEGPVPALPLHPSVATEMADPPTPAITTPPLPELRMSTAPSQVRLAAVPGPKPVPQPAALEPLPPEQPTKAQRQSMQPAAPKPATAQRPSDPTIKHASSITARPFSPKDHGYAWEEVDHPPTIVRRFSPQYPYRARRKGITGTVVVRFLITVDGTVSSAKIMRAEPAEIFENAVLSCVRKWKFRPGRLRGKPVPTWAELPFRFKL